MCQYKFSMKLSGYCFLLLMLLVSCNGEPKEILPTAELILEATPTKNPNLTQSPTNQAISTPVDEIESPVLNGIRYECLAIGNDTLFSAHQARGVLVMHDVKYKSVSQSNLELFDIETRERKNLSIDYYFSSYSTSPEGNFVAVLSYTLSPNYSTSIDIFNSSGVLITRIQGQNHFPDLEWLNEETLLINTMSGNNPLRILSPFNNATEELIQPYFNPPIFFPTELIYDWGFYAHHKNIYDSRLERVIYPSQDENGSTIVLRDIVAGKDIASYATISAWGISPKWSPDGRNFAIGIIANDQVRADRVAKYEIVIINRNGEQLVKTNFSSTGDIVRIQSLSWSPNSRYVAFWYNKNSNDIGENLELAVLDIKTQEITNYCIMNTFDEIYSKRNDFSPIWSPDSNFLLIKAASPENQAPTIFIIDITNGRAIPINIDSMPVGWLQ